VNYVLSKNTANELKKLIDAKPGSSTGHNNQAGQRQVGYVLITSKREGYEGQFWATVQAYDVVLSNWRSFDSCLVLKANDSDLIAVGKRYLGVRYGKTTVDGGIKSVWVVGYSIELGCGLWFNDDDQLAIYTQDIAGQGLNYDDTYCQLYIDPGCGITLEGGKKVGVNAEALAGTCLVKEDDCKLGIDLTEQDGPVFSAITAVSLYGNCYGIYLNWAVTPFNFKTNPCGLFLGFEAGEAFSSSTYVPLGCCCGDDPPPPPPPPPACEGSCEWNYVEGTGWVLVSGGCPEGCYCPEPLDYDSTTTYCVSYPPLPPPPPPPPPPPEGCCVGLPNVLYVTFTSGCNNLSFPITWDGSQWWGYTGPDMDCDNNASAILSCNDGVWYINAVASFCGPGTGTLTVHSCSPFSASFVGIESGMCNSGPVTLTITE
jgi:hypothetical protein